MIKLLKFGTPKQQLEVTKCFRRLLSTDSISTANKFHDQVIGAGLVPKFFEFLQRDDFELQLEAAWTLANYAAACVCHMDSGCKISIIYANAFPLLVKLLSSQSENLQEKALWCLFNIASECRQCCNSELDHGILAPLIEYVNKLFLSIFIKIIFFLNN